MCRSNLAAVASLFSGPIVVAGSNGSPSRTRVLVSLDDPLGELGPHPRLHQEPLARRAALPGAQVGGLERSLGGELQVGVVEDHHRAVAAELEQLGLARGPRRDLAAGLHRADEPHAGHQRMADHGVADHRARARRRS